MDEKQISNKDFHTKIGLFSFILSTLVIYTHSYNAELFLLPNNSMLYNIENILASKISQIAVPGFFMISSYLFFRNISIYNMIPKLKRRFYSIFIPYILWNFIYYLGYIISSHIPYLSRIVGKGIIKFSIDELFFAIFLHKYNYVFWFVYQLIILILISPILYFFLRNKYIAMIGAILISILLFINIDLKFINTDALFYYYMAGFFSLHFSHIVEKNYSVNTSLISIILVLFGIYIYRLTFYTNQIYFIVYARFIFIAALWLFLNETITKSTIINKYKSYFSNTFLVYATHLAIVRLINKTTASIFPNNNILAAILFLSMPILIFALITPVIFIIKTELPIFYSLISGRR